ncbi:hypothetical protein ACRDNQ_08240 [Palleronia sp. KMU-117]|uniref:hypothetical protein n=1 Tax=Palleronia sp. KMU-117 TaxID=3434108 RepID=UPI003D754BF7
MSDFDPDNGRAQSFASIVDLGVSVHIGVTEWDAPVAVAEPVSVTSGLASDQ